ncbi:hypothetical protein AB0Y14_00965 [Rothia sp. HC945]|uniref:hypothetical protein n=1 Tax=Rothia sp. HC945 TaxID=3171170 RepID=UPI0026541687|nr:hypothetical protein [Kocuria sp.]
MSERPFARAVAAVAAIVAASAAESSTSTIRHVLSFRISAITDRSFTQGNSRVTWGLPDWLLVPGPQARVCV